jgi:23S rRNA (uracil1939-C5)-methyltransferase
MKKVIIHGTCVDYSSEGYGIIKSKEGITFAYSLFKGEEADVEIYYQRAHINYGKVIKLYKISPHRITPLCPVSTACGGCQFQQLDYPSELEYKRSKVQTALSKIAHLNVEVLPVIGMDSPYHYRNKIQMPFGLDHKNNIICGFYRNNSHEIIPIDECSIEDKRANKILLTIKKLMKSMKISPYDEDRRSGIIRHVLIRTSFYYKEIMVTLVCNVDSFPSRNNFVKALIKECPEITTIVENINNRASNVILGDKERILYGKGFIRDSLCGINFKISSKSFYQTNPVQTEKLYSLAMKYASLNKDDVVLDAYSGIGTIGLIAASKVKEVLSVEVIREAYKNALENAKDNNIKNFVAINDDASEYSLALANQNKHIDVLFMDPPRKGSDEKFLSSVLRLRPKRIIYISCDPATLARDIAYLNNDYRVNIVQPVDMFCRTYHIETIVELSLKPEISKNRYMTGEDIDMLRENEYYRSNRNEVPVADRHEDGA